MTDEKTVQCPACTADLTPGMMECPWCGHLMAPKTEEGMTMQIPPEPARVPTPTEPGFSEPPLVSKKAPASSLKVMGIILTIFSFLALVFFVFQVLDGRFTRLVLLLPIIGMIIGLISIAVGQKR